MVYLVHHADAVSPAEDPARPLSARGRATAALLADQAARLGVKPALVWHSGKLRTRQTGEAFWRACNPLATFSAERGLQPDDPPMWVRDRLFGETRDVMVVSHMPFLPRLLRALLSEGPGAGEASFPLNGVVALAPDGDRWVETWRLDPAELTAAPLG
ncbi:MAG: histidine phosphatase family protein [Vicinamibacterales bacterium]|nr:histidine phosphatase family protein [Vicinamibacterales bacterium]